ncbi:hypothetical protein D0T66_04140 [Dysgonomonas sp. 25]|nr:hypothetical protein [Dysgonomonas sp. 25]
MFVGDNAVNATQAVMYVDGSMKYASSGTAAGTVVVEQDGITELTGDIIDAMAAKDPSAPDKLFVNTATPTKQGVISFVGEEKTQYIYRDRTAAVKSADGYNYLNFPTIRVAQKLTSPHTLPTQVDMTKNLQVVVWPFVAMSVDNIEVGDPSKIGADRYGAFTVEASYNTEDHVATMSADEARKLYIPRVFIDKVNGSDADNAGASSAGWMRYNLKLNNCIFKDGSQVWDINKTIYVGNDANKRHLTPFSSPFKETALDYMYYSFVMSVGATSSTWLPGLSITDPRFRMKAGSGYFMAMEAGVNVADNAYLDFNPNPTNTAVILKELTFAHDFKDIYDNNNNINPFGRVKGEIQFSRKLLADYHNTPAVSYYKEGYSQFASNAVSLNSLKEYFTRSTQGIDVQLNEGLNFVANPYMLPLDLEPLLNTAPGDGGDTFDLPAGTISNTHGANKIRSKFWVIHNSYIEHIGNQGWWGDAYKFYINAYIAQYDGSTSWIGPSGPSPSVYYAPPLSVFAVEASDPILLKFRARVEADVAPTDLRKNVTTPKSVKSSLSTPVDEVLFSTVNKTTGIEDRISLVFRDKMMTDAEYKDINVHKMFARSVAAQDKVSYLEGALYTKTTDGDMVPLAINALPTDIKQLALYVVPPKTGEQVIEITPYRMNTLQSIDRIWIEDKLTGDIKEMLPEESLEYTIAATGENPKNGLKNRFVLYFNELPNDAGNVIPEESPLAVSYFQQTIYVTGLQDIDNGSRLEVYDLQGRLVAKDIIDSVGERMEIYKPLSQGAYVVKITGKRNYRGKFMSLKN